MAKRSSNKPLSRVALERQRAKAARDRYLLAKKRSDAARKGWKTRRNPDNLFESMVRHLTSFKDSGQKRYYTLFRTAKRMLYEYAGPYEAELLAHNAADVAGWEFGDSLKFAKLS